MCALYLLLRGMLLLCLSIGQQSVSCSMSKKRFGEKPCQRFCRSAHETPHSIGPYLGLPQETHPSRSMS